MTHRRLADVRPALLGLAFAALFAISAVRHLDVVPPVYEDEPWQASTAYKLLTEGVFGSDLFTGFFNMDQRYYGFMPLHPLLLAGFFRLLGVGLLQARLETVSLSLLTLLLVYWLAVRLGDAWVGAIAVALLVAVRWTGLTYVQLTGIPLVDFARISRYDPLVPVVGLAAMHAYLRAWSSRHLRWYVLSGLLAGLAGLAHVYGLFFVPVLLVLCIWNGTPRTAGAGRLSSCAVGWLLLGAALPWLPYLAYVLTDLPDWRGQTLIYASRFGLLDPRWYVDNLANEYHRYGPGLGPFGPAWLARIGLWLVLVALPASLVLLGRRAVRQADIAARIVIVPAVLLPVLFAVLITLKLVNYTLVELPFFALAIGCGVVSAWRTRWRLWLRPILAALAVAVVAEGGAQLVRLDQAAATSTPYPRFIAEIRTLLPPGARVLGLHSYWLGLQEFDFRSFLVPLNWADDGEPMGEALTRVDPDIVLLDVRMRTYFASPAAGGDGLQFTTWLTRRSGRVIGRLDDPTYGLMEIYQLERSSPASTRAALDRAAADQPAR